MSIEPLEILHYWTADGKCPYQDWFNSLKDPVLRQIIDARLTRVERGLLGEARWVGQGVFELKLRVGAGIRIYFGMEGKRLILLLCGGDKKSQDKDIKKAFRYWGDYLRRSQS